MAAKTFDDAFGALVTAWRRHDDLRTSGSLADRLDARIELADRRLAMARILSSEGR